MCREYNFTVSKICKWSCYDRKIIKLVTVYETDITINAACVAQWNFMNTIYYQNNKYTLWFKIFILLNTCFYLFIILLLYCLAKNFSSIILSRYSYSYLVYLLIYIINFVHIMYICGCMHKMFYFQSNIQISTKKKELYKTIF